MLMSQSAGLAQESSGGPLASFAGRLSFGFEA